jgi:hypothetical protein
MPREKNTGGREIDLNQAASELYAKRAGTGTHAENEGDVFSDLIESLDYLANVAAFFLKKKGIQDRLFSAEEFEQEFGE